MRRNNTHTQKKKAKHINKSHQRHRKKRRKNVIVNGHSVSINLTDTQGVSEWCMWTQNINGNFNVICFFCRSIFYYTCEFCRIWLMAANDAMQWPGFWWCACGSMSSLIGNGLKSHGVCVELLVTVMSSALAIAPFVTDDAVELQMRFWSFNSLVYLIFFLDSNTHMKKSESKMNKWHVWHTNSKSNVLFKLMGKLIRMEWKRTKSIRTRTHEQKNRNKSRAQQKRSCFGDAKQITVAILWQLWWQCDGVKTATHSTQFIEWGMFFVAVRLMFLRHVHTCRQKETSASHVCVCADKLEYRVNKLTYSI